MWVKIKLMDGDRYLAGDIGAFTEAAADMVLTCKQVGSPIKHKPFGISSKLHGYPEGYWVCREVAETENEFGLVCP